MITTCGFHPCHNITLNKAVSANLWANPSNPVLSIGAETRNSSFPLPSIQHASNLSLDTSIPITARLCSFSLDCVRHNNTSSFVDCGNAGIASQPILHSDEGLYGPINQLWFREAGNRLRPGLTNPGGTTFSCLP